MNNLSQTECAFILATPLMEPSAAVTIGWRAGRMKGHRFAAFAKRRPELFERKAGSNLCFNYRLSEAGAALRREIECEGGSSA